MSSTQLGNGDAKQAPGVATMSAKFEVTTLPVADVDRAKAFYLSLGWRLDIDFKPSPDTRAVQFTPPGSQASIQFGQGATMMEPGNTWVLQEITERLPGRVEVMDSGALAELLHETALRHGSFEAVAPPHDWWDWYAAYMAARQSGSAPDEAAKAADRYMAEVKDVVVTR